MQPNQNATRPVAISNTAKTAVKSGKHRHLFFCFLPLSIFVLLGLGIRGGGYWLLLPIVFLFLVVPLLDLVTGWQDTVHFESGDFTPLETSLLNWNTRLYALL